MKKFIVIITIIIVLLFLVIAAYLVYMDKVDTIYAINYGKCFGDYSIGRVDRFLDDTTLITYNGTTKTYSELKSNVKNAFQDRIFVMGKGSSYGSGNGFINGTQKVDIQSYVSVDGKDREVYVEMVLRKVGLKVQVESLNSTDEFFGYLFFGAPFKKNGW